MRDIVIPCFIANFRDRHILIYQKFTSVSNSHFIYHLRTSFMSSAFKMFSFEASNVPFLIPDWTSLSFVRSVFL